MNTPDYLFDKQVAREISKQVLENRTGIANLHPDKPIPLSKGNESPMYMDHRKVLSSVPIRDVSKKYFLEILKTRFPETQTIAGVATGGIGMAAILGDNMGMPVFYVRDKPKGYGMNHLIEGHLEPGQNVVVIEDTILTGKGGLDAVREIRRAGGNVLGLLAQFNYGFPETTQAFREAKCPFVVLNDFFTLISVASSMNMISAKEREIIEEWHQNPGG